MIPPEQIAQAATLLVFILIFEIMEHGHPGFPIDKRRRLGLNILALLIVIVVGEIEKGLLFFSLQDINIVPPLAKTYIYPLPGMIKVFLAIVLFDFTLYWIHRTMHQDWLWPTHVFHHSIEELWWLSGSRTSVLHILLFAIPQTYIGFYLIGLTPWQAAAALSFGVVINLWVHINVWVNLGPLEAVFITPNYHRIHHAALGTASRNLGFVFTFWDRWFGTCSDPGRIGKDFPLYPAPTEKQLLRMLFGL